MSAPLAVVAAFAALTGAREIVVLDEAAVAVATDGGVAVYVDGVVDPARSRLGEEALTVGLIDGALVAGTGRGAWRLADGTWTRVGPARAVVAVVGDDVVYRDGTTWRGGDVGGRVVAAAAWQGGVVGVTAEGQVLREGVVVAEVGGPVVDVAVVDGRLRVALSREAAIVSASGEVERLPIRASAAGPVWGTVWGQVVDDWGRELAQLHAWVRAVAAVPGGFVVGTAAGTTRVAANGEGVPGVTLERFDSGLPCPGGVSGLTVHRGELVVGTFEHGLCRGGPGAWRKDSVPSELVNDVLSDGRSLWVATSEGLVRDGFVYGAVAEDAPAGAPGLNHEGVNDLALGRAGLWAADVLGPTRVSPSWRRYRWAVSGHSYQAVAACDDGAVWLGSEDDGLAVRGVAVGRRNGRSSWYHVNRLDGLPEDWVMALACAGEGAAWVGTYRHGVGRFDVTGWTPLVEGAWVQDLLADGDTLWIGTADGLLRADAAGVATVLDADVRALYRDRGTLWVGTDAGVIGLRVD